MVYRQELYKAEAERDAYRAALDNNCELLDNIVELEVWDGPQGKINIRALKSEAARLIAARDVLKGEQ